MKTLSLPNNFLCFDNRKALQDLNHLVELHTSLMPHQVAAATGCSLDDAMGILVLLFTQSLAEGLLLVYHNSDATDPPTPFLTRNILEGLPSVPLTCDACGREIENQNELSYDFLFKITDKVSFIL